MTDTAMIQRYNLLRGIEPGTFPPQSDSGLRTRRKELTDAGVVVDTQVRKRLPSGRQSIVWGLAL